MSVGIERAATRHRTIGTDQSSASNTQIEVACNDRIGHGDRAIDFDRAIADVVEITVGDVLADGHIIQRGACVEGCRRA